MKKDFFTRFGEAFSPHSYFAPGRVNLIGEHIDYNGGLVLPIAISLGIEAMVQPTQTDFIRIQSLQAPGELILDIKTPDFSKREAHWQNYPLGILQFLHQKDIPLQACQILLNSTLPMGSGLSSSAAIEVLTAYLFLHLAEQPIDTIQIAQWAQQVENEFMGVQCGIMDQYAVANAQANKAMLLDCASLDCQQIPFQLEAHQLLILDSKNPRKLADSKYNERKKECEEALAIIQKALPVPNLCATPLMALSLLKNPVLNKRAKHVITEQKRVQQAAQALQKDNFSTFGKLMTDSHKSLKNDYEVTGEALDTIVEAALKHPACVGARMTGAGFGGCAIALVDKLGSIDFIEFVLGEYQQKMGTQAAIYEAQAFDGVGIL